MLPVALLVICLSCQGQLMLSGARQLMHLPGKKALMITNAAVGFGSPTKGRVSGGTVSMIKFDAILMVS